jgi:hypothetical protein
MDITSTNSVPDVYDQRSLIERAINEAYADGLGCLHIRVIEPADSLDWHWSVTGEDGRHHTLVTSALDQMDLAGLPSLLKHRLRELLAA